MAQASIKKNFAYKSILTISSYIMGFIIFPYISRVFGVERLGLVNFVDNTINYFLLFATMGIGILGVREIAAVKNNRKECCKVFSNILGLNFIFTITVLVIYLVLIILIPKLNQYSELFYIGTAKILFTTFLIEWFYTGIENFKYITVRSIVIKLLYVILVFIFVKQKDDYGLYFFLTVGIVVVNAIINMLYSKKYVTPILGELFNFKYIKNNITLGIYSIMTSMYITFNVMYLGLVCDNIQVGYYTTAFKLYSVILGFFTAFTNVMLPRMSALIAEGNNDRFHELINKSFAAVIKFSVPLILYSIILAPQIIYVLSGPGYDGAIFPMRIIMPAILLVGIAQVLAIQVLMPMKKDRILLLVSIVGAVVSILLNILLIHRLNSVGSAIVLISCEFVVTFIYVFVSKYYLNLHIKISLTYKYMLVLIMLVVFCVIIRETINNSYLIILLSAIIVSSVYMILYYIERQTKKS